MGIACVILCLMCWLGFGYATQDFIGTDYDNIEKKVGYYLFWSVYLAIGFLTAMIVIIIVVIRFFGKVIWETLKELISIINSGYNEIKDCFKN